MANESVPARSIGKRIPELTVSREIAEAQLRTRINLGLELRKIRIDSLESLKKASNEYSKWSLYNKELLETLFTTSERSEAYNSVASIKMPTTLSEAIEHFQENIDTKIHRIESIIDRLEFNLPSSSVQEPMKNHPKSNRVFVVHGHDEIAKTNLEIFLREIGLEPVVLHRQADEGQTIIEKFEKHSDVGYAFILLTPDEIAYLKSETSKDDTTRKTEFRARPNVIFEFGYFVGKLGRSRVCCLHTGNVSLPSDVSGMIYKRYENKIEEVAYDVIKDLKAAGYVLK